MNLVGLQCVCVSVCVCAYPPTLCLFFSLHTQNYVPKYVLSVQCSWDYSEETKKSGKVRYHFHSVLHIYRAIFLKLPKLKLVIIAPNFRFVFLPVICECNVDFN